MKSAIDRYIVEAVRKKRLQKGFVQADLGIALGVSTSFIGHVENPKGRARYNFLHLNKLAAYMGCSPRDFLPEKPLEDEQL